MPREFLLVTPFQALAGFGIWLLAIFVALALGWWLRGAELPESPEVDPANEVTAEIRTRAPLARPRHTGTVHVPGVRPVPADDPTVVIRLPKEVGRP